MPDQGSGSNQTSTTSSTYLPLPAQFNATDDDCNVYDARLKQFFLADNVTDDNRKAAVILTSLSNEVFKILSNLCFPDDPDKKSFSEI